jgi:hypothetical protein
MIPRKSKVKYLTNRELMSEIHKSKCTYSSFIDSKYAMYDLIVKDLDSITPEAIDQAKLIRAKRQGNELFVRLREAGDRKTKLAECVPDPAIIEKTDLVFRIMTYDHVPLSPGRKRVAKTVADTKERVNFSPFQHWAFDQTDQLICAGKSHWVGGMDNGYFSKDHGYTTENLGLMFMMLAERYAQRGNWRGYCVDDQTEALTQRGWLGIDKINENDQILSYSLEEKILKWSMIKSIYRGEFNGKMHHLTSTSIDSLITPNHKIVTSRGLVPVELVKQSDQIIVMAGGLTSPPETYTDSFVELVGWIMTEGCYEINKETSKIKRICIYQNSGTGADRIRQCLIKEDFKFSESNSKNICFSISRQDSRKISSMFTTKNLTMDFILALSQRQRELLIDTLVTGDGWTRKNSFSYTQKNRECIDMVQALLTISGIKSNRHFVENHISFGKETSYYTLNAFTSRRNKSRGECINFNGGMVNGENQNRAKGKSTFPNIPTTPHKGMVWCPETEYGTFVARRNGKVYITGNTYIDEMKGQAILQLSQVGLQFDESKSENPFAYFTSVVNNSFTRILNLEKKNQNIRDDLLEDSGYTPSSTRQSQDLFADENARQAKLYKTIKMPKSSDDTSDTIVDED